MPCISLKSVRLKNIFEEEVKLNSPERVLGMIETFKQAGFKNIIVFDDKNDKEFIQVEQKVRKQLEMA